MKFLKNLAAILVILICLTILTFPVITKLDSVVVGRGGDSYQYLGFQGLAAEQLERGNWPFQKTNLWRYPVGFDYSRGYDSMLSNLFGGVLAVITKDHILSYNLTIFCSFLFNVLAAYALFNQVTKSRKMALVGAISVGFSFYNLSRSLGHANLLLTGGFSLFLYALIRLRNNQKLSSFILLGVSVGVIGLSSVQYFLMLIVACLIMLPIYGLLNFSEISRYLQIVKKNKSKTFFSVALAGVLLALVLLPVAQAVIEGDFAWRTDSDYSPHLSNFFMPLHMNQVLFSSKQVYTTVHDNQNESIEWMAYVGVFELVLFFVLLIWSLLKGKIDKNDVFLLIGIVIFVIFSLGTKNPDTGVIMPYHWLIDFYPFKAISEPARYVIIFNLFLMLFVCRKLVFMFKKHTTASIVSFLLIVLFISERVSWGGFATTPNLDGKFAKVVQTLPGEAVFDIPAFDERIAYHPVLYKKSIINGYPHWLGDTNKGRSFINYNDEITRYFCDRQPNKWDFNDDAIKLSELKKNQQMLSRLKENKVNTIVVNKDYKLFGSEWCESVMAQATLLVPRLNIAQDSGLTQKDAYSEWVANEMRAGLFFPQSGKVRIVKINFYPSLKSEELTISLDGREIDLSTWIYQEYPGENGPVIWASPKDDTQFWDVSAGSKLIFSSSKYSSGYVTISYQYSISDKAEPMASYSEKGLVKVFEDKDKMVLQIE
ncbi:MAG: hypothetical protein ACOZAN_04030 [Patescibacteria group bacterium]